jgi:hypothetical protein
MNAQFMETLLLEDLVMKTMLKSPMLIAASIVSIILLSNEAAASVTLQPVAASTNMGEYVGSDPPGTPLVFSASHVIDQSDLYIPYVSGVTGFDSYLALHPTAAPAMGHASWLASAGVQSGNFDLDLGGTYTVSAMALWNLFDDPSAIRQFNILLDDNASFSSPVEFSGFTASNSLGPAPDESFAQVFNFEPTVAHFVRLEILNTYPGSFAASFNEVMFGVSPIPEPETSALLLAGLGLIGFTTRRRKPA